MMQNYYDIIVMKLYDAIKNKDLGNVLEKIFMQYIEILCGEEFDDATKSKFAIIALADLNNIENFPNKTTNRVR